jgi:hypothetical protein
MEVLHWEVRAVARTRMLRHSSTTPRLASRLVSPMRQLRCMAHCTEVLAVLKGARHNPMAGQRERFELSRERTSIHSDVGDHTSEVHAVSIHAVPEPSSPPTGHLVPQGLSITSASAPKAGYDPPNNAEQRPGSKPCPQDRSEKPDQKLLGFEFVACCLDDWAKIGELRNATRVVCIQLVNHLWRVLRCDNPCSRSHKLTCCSRSRPTVNSQRADKQKCWRRPKSEPLLRGVPTEN